jgi:hypothetical protein
VAPSSSAPIKCDGAELSKIAVSATDVVASAKVSLGKLQHLRQSTYGLRSKLNDVVRLVTFALHEDNFWVKVLIPAATELMGS